MSLYAGLDVGTQSVKLVLYDPQLRQVVATQASSLALTSDDDGTREQQAEWWIQAIVACLAAVPATLRSRVRAIGVSGQQHGLVPVATDGQVTAPVKLWCDTSTQAQAQALTAALGGAEAAVVAAGNPILVGYTASKLPWMRLHRPQAYAAMATILLPHDYVNFWLTGECFMEAGDASGTGWLDVRTRAWSSTVLRAIDPERDLHAALPPLVAPDTVFALTTHAARALGLPAGVRVSVGGGDNMMAAIGTGNVVPGRLTMSLGTSGTLFTYAERPIVDAAGRWAAFCDSTGGWLPLICTMNCTVATDVAARMGGLTRAQSEAAVAATAPGAAGLVMLPFLNGERSPDLPAARGMLFGMDLHNSTAAHLYRAAMEGATYSLRAGQEALIQAGLRFDTLVLTGGGAHSTAWRQMVADVFDLPVEVPCQLEGAAFGAALQALWACQRADGEVCALADVVLKHVQLDPLQGAHPDLQRVAAYDRGYRCFQRYLAAAEALYRPSPS